MQTNEQARAMEVAERIHEAAMVYDPLTSISDFDFNAAARVIETALAERDAEVKALREALSDLVSWFPEKPPEPEWKIRAGKFGADDALEAARALLNWSTPDAD